MKHSHFVPRIRICPKGAVMKLPKRWSDMIDETWIELKLIVNERQVAVAGDQQVMESSLINYQYLATTSPSNSPTEPLHYTAHEKNCELKISATHRIV